MEILLKLGIFLILAILGYWRGRKNERLHLKWLDAEEKKLADILVFATRYPPRMDRTMDPILVSGSVAVGSDFFRLLIAALRKIVGGNYRSYEKLMERGRRHALIKLKQHTKDRGARMVFNVRYTTSRISDSRAGEAAQMEILAYGTAFVPAVGSVAQSRVHHQANLTITDLDGQTDLVKHPASRWWIVAWFIGVAYCFVEMFTDSVWAHSWRYINGAPWWWFSVFSLLLSGWLVHNGRRRKLPWAESIVLAVLTAPLLVFVMYFGCLRINGITAFDVSPTLYTHTGGNRLQPGATSRKPVLEFIDHQDYWSLQKPGGEVAIVVARGWLGFYQYDINSLRERYRSFYASQP